MSILIRTATQQDAIDISGLNLELGYFASLDQVTEWLNVLLKSSDHRVLVAVDEDKVVGWMTVERRLTLESGFKAEITGLVVNANLRRSGVGKKLADAAEQWAIENNLPRLFVRSNVTRIESHPFYLKQGFSRIKTAHCYEKNII